LKELDYILSKNKKIRKRNFYSANMQRVPTFTLDKASVTAALNRLHRGVQPYFGPKTTNSIGCFLAQKSGNKSEGSGWVKLKVGSRNEYYAHHLALVACRQER